MSEDDPFDLDQLALTNEQIGNLAPLQKKSSSTKPKQQKGKSKFVILPYEHTLKAAGRGGEATLAVLIELHYRRFKRHQNPVSLPNGVLQSVGISRWQKLRALDRLETMGLVKVISRCGRSPLVKIL